MKIYIADNQDITRAGLLYIVSQRQDCESKLTSDKSSLIEALKEDSLSPDARVLHEAEKLAIILGTEGEGLAADTIADCDYTVCIPMARGVDSLNVAAASAVAFWELCR